MNSIRPLLYPVAELLPHTGSAILLDRVLDYGTDWVESEVTHQNPSLYADSNGNVPIWAGIEYMAQTIALFAGLEAKKYGEAIRPGFLLGTRSYNAAVDFFTARLIIKIRAELRYRDDNNIAMFNCKITDYKNVVMATAEIKCFQSEKIDDMLKELSRA